MTQAKGEKVVVMPRPKEKSDYTSFYEKSRAMAIYIVIWTQKPETDNVLIFPEKASFTII